MHIAIIGAGNVGKALGQNWAKRGHDVTYGVRNPADAKYAPLNSQRLKTASIADAARAAEAILLSTPWGATENALAPPAIFRASWCSMRPTRWPWGRRA